MTVTDAHVHFWDPEHLDYAWLQEAPSIRTTHLPQDYRTASKGVDVEAMVFVEADCAPEQSLAEVDWVQSLAEDEPRLRAIVAAAPLERGTAAESHLKALRERPLVRGVRRLIQSEKAGFCTQAAFIEAVRTLPHHGFSFDLCLKHHQLPDVLALVEACPETAFILDHIAKPDIARNHFDTWRRDLDELASLPQVIGCKVSGVITEADWKTWTVEDLEPYVHHAIEAFGTDRVLYGSDWPVSVLAGGYQRWWEAFSALIEGLDKASRRKIRTDNARRIYRLDA